MGVEFEVEVEVEVEVEFEVEKPALVAERLATNSPADIDGGASAHAQRET